MSSSLARIGLIIAAVCCCVATAGSRPRPAASPSSERPKRDPAVARIIYQANQAYRAADYTEARRLYSEGLKIAQPESEDAAALLLGIGNCDLFTHQYAAALQAYNAAAAYSRWKTTAVLIATGRASVYRRMGNHEAAKEAMRQVEGYLTGDAHPVGLLQAANIWRDLDMAHAEALYRAAIASSVDTLEAETAALAWNQFGHALMGKGELERAEAALTEAFRLRRLHQSRQLQTSYFYLAQLKRKQGDLRTAAHLLERAFEEKNKQIPPPYLHHEKGLIARLSGRRQAALLAFRQALATAREWRVRMLPAQDFRVTAELGLRQIYCDYVDAAMQEYEATGNQKAMEEAFAASEQERSLLFEETLSRERGYPPEYWGALAKYQRALTESLNDRSKEKHGLVHRYWLELADIEAASGGANTRVSSHKISETRPPGFLLRGLQRKLSGLESLISFHVGDTSCFRWEVTKKGITGRRIGDPEEIRTLVRKFRAALESRRAPQEEGTRLAAVLLGGLSAPTQASRDWILSLDGPLFELPVAALPAGAEGRYLVIEKSIRIVPGAWTEYQPVKGVSEKFVGVADPIYNRADPRWQARPRGPAGHRMLARLPGSAQEIRNAAAAWGRDRFPTLLTGREVSAGTIRASVRKGSAILHIASHVVRHPAEAEQVLIALGLGKNGDPEYLGPSEVASWRCAIGLVVLSGCGSGEGESLPGLGLFGMSRAWLQAGAMSVITTMWPVPDDDGRLARVLYERLGGYDRIGPVEVARALQDAQKAMLDAGGSVADPVYWASFSVMGKE